MSGGAGTNGASNGDGRRRGTTMRDVAQSAGVSVAVVSYAFNRPDRVAANTRERVLATAHSLGYRGPDPAARALRLGRRGAVALVTAGAVEDLLADPAATQVARGMARACDTAGVTLLLSCGTEADADGAVLLRGAAARWRGRCPAVAVDAEGDGQMPRVLAMVRDGAFDVARHLAELGHRRLAVIGWPEAGPRLQGAADGWGRGEGIVAYRASESTPAAGQVAAASALSADPRPDAILGLSDALALGAMAMAGAMGLDVPGELSVAGIDDLPGSEAVGLTSVSVPYRPMGDRAGRLLAQLLETGATADPTPMPTMLVPRRSTGGPRTR